MIHLLKKYFATLGLLWAAMFGGTLQAHTFYEGLVDISLNPNNHHLEVVHHYTTHDLTVLLSESHNKQITADSKQFEPLLKAYLEDHFSIKKNGKALALNWVGIEAGVSETVIYQELKLSKDMAESQQGFLSASSVDCRMLSDFYSHQINRVVYNDGKNKGTLIFNDRSIPQRIQ